MSKYPFPVWATQGGGLAREVDGKLIFITNPDCPGLDVGYDVPEEWGIEPANALARMKSDDHEYMSDFALWVKVFQSK